MLEVLLVAIMTLPNTNNVAYEVNGTYASYDACNAAKRQAEQVPQTIKTAYACLKSSKD
jgi:hypothetical protein